MLIRMGLLVWRDAQRVRDCGGHLREFTYHYGGLEGCLMFGGFWLLLRGYFDIAGMRCWGCRRILRAVTST